LVYILSAARRNKKKSRFATAERAYEI